MLLALNIYERMLWFVCFVTVILKQELCLGVLFFCLGKACDLPVSLTQEDLLELSVSVASFSTFTCHLSFKFNWYSVMVLTKAILVMAAVAEFKHNCTIVLWEVQMEFLRLVLCTVHAGFAWRFLGVLLLFLCGWWHLKNTGMQSLCPVELW